MSTQFCISLITDAFYHSINSHVNSTCGGKRIVN